MIPIEIIISNPTLRNEFKNGGGEIIKAVR